MGRVARAIRAISAHQGQRCRPVQGSLNPGRDNAGGIQIGRYYLSLRKGEVIASPSPDANDASITLRRAWTARVRPPHYQTRTSCQHGTSAPTAACAGSREGTSYTSI